jgi:general secretion pathway protein F
LASLSLILAVVVPRIAQMFESAGERLPWYTQLVVGAGGAVEQYWWLMLGVVLAAALWLRYDYARPDGRRRWDRVMLATPVCGSLVEQIETARFARSLGTMLSNGVPLLDAVAISRAIVSNVVIARGIERMAGGIRATPSHGIATRWRSQPRPRTRARSARKPSSRSRASRWPRRRASSRTSASPPRG